MSAARPLPTLVVATALALGSAVSLGLARFAYALLLPAMRVDLGWSYFTAGAMNTVNAAGYLVGAHRRQEQRVGEACETERDRGTQGERGRCRRSSSPPRFAHAPRAASRDSATSTKPRPRSKAVTYAGHCFSRSAKSAMLATPTESGKLANISSSLVESPT